MLWNNLYICIHMNRVWSIIPREYRRRTIWLTTTIFVRALLNFVGIASLIPILILILDRQALESNQYIISFCKLLHISDYNALATMLCAIIVAIVVFKNIIILLLNRIEQNYIFDLYKNLSERLYQFYWQQGLGFIKSKNSSILSRNINSTSLMFATGVIKPIATIISESILIMLVVVALSLYNYQTALIIAGLFIPIASIFYLGLRRKLHATGESENEAQRTKSRIVAESIRGYVDINLTDAFPLTFRRFVDATNNVVKLRKRHALISQSPQAFAEMGIVVAMSALILLSLQDEANVGLIFSIFAIAALRLLPSLRNILLGWSNLQYNIHTSEVLAEIKDFSVSSIHHSDEKLPLMSQVELRSVTFNFEDTSLPVINDFSLVIKRGERIGIRGASGIGKTTLLNIIAGIYKPMSGDIAIDGEVLCDSNIRKWQNSIGYVPQSVFILDGSIAENIALGCDPDKIDYARVNHVIEIAELKDFIDRCPRGIHTHIGEQGARLSGGQRQRIGIARALYRECDILLFDEATSSLDDSTEQNINSAIERLSASNYALTIVVVAHRTSSLEYCDRIITMGQ